MSRRLFAALVLLALAVAALWIGGGRSPAVRPPEASLQHAEASAEHVVPPAAAEPPLRSASAEQAPAPQPEVAAADLLVVAVRFSDGRPAPGVRVLLEAAVVERPQMRVPLDESQAAGAEALARLSYRSWKELAAKAAESGFSVRLVVRADLPLEPPVLLELGAEPPAEQPLIMKLPPEVTAESIVAANGPLAVLVQDQAGRPVGGVNVLLEAIPAGALDARNLVGQAVSGAADGIARIALDEWREGRVRWQALGASLRLDLRADTPLAEPVLVHLGEDVPAEQPVILNLPEVGSLRIEVRTSSGAPPPAGARANLRWRLAGSPPEAPFERGHDFWHPVVDGVALYAGIGLGLELSIGVSQPDHESNEPLLVAGPTRAGEEVQAAIALGSPATWVRGRLVAADGISWSQDSVLWSLTVAARAPARRDQLWLKVGADGTFRVRVPAVEPQLRSRRLLVRTGEPGRGPDQGGDTLVAAVELPASLAPGSETDLGDIQLTLEPLLVDGQVVDQAGTPVADAWVEIRIARSDPGDFHDSERLLYRRLEAREEGRFRVRHSGPVAAVSVFAGAHQQQLAPASLEQIPPGQSGLRLVLPPAGGAAEPQPGSLLVTTLLPPEVPSLLLYTEVRTEGGQRTRELVGGMTEFSGLSPGRARLRILTQETDWPVASVEDLEIPAGGRCSDPRLRDLDLRSLVRLQRVLVLGAGGRPLAGARLQVEDSSGHGGTVEADLEGRLELVLPAALETVWIGAEGLQAASLVAGPAEAVIHLFPE